MRIIESKTGAEIKIAPAPFKDAIALKNAIFKELSKTGVNIDKFDLKANISEFLTPILQVDSSKDVYDAFFKCAVRCLYNGNKITEDVFEDSTAREDYYFIMLEVFKENLTPFFKGLVSGLSLVMPQAESKKKAQK